MKSLKKIATSLSICVLIFATFFGCTFVGINDKTYYNQIVASVKLTETYDNKVITVNVRELLDGLTNFGYSNYFEDANDDEAYESGVISTITSLINRKVILHIITTAEDDNGNLIYELNDYDKKEAMKNAIDSVNQSIKTNEDYVKEKKGIEELPEENEVFEGTHDSPRKDEPYEKKVFRADVNGDGILDIDEYTHKTVPKKENDESVKAIDLDKSVFDNFRFTSPGNDDAASVEDKEIFFEAKFELFRSLRTYYESFGEKNLTDNQLLARHLDFAYESNKGDAYIEKMQKAYEATQTEGANAFFMINTQIVNLFKQRYVLEKDKYPAGSTAAIDKYRAGLKSNSVSGENYYIPAEVSGEYFLVQHILLKYSPEQTAQIEEQKKKLEKGYIEQEDYDAFIESISEQIEVDNKKYSTIAEEINNYCGTELLNSLGDRASLFREKMFEYTADDATLTAEGDYIIPTKRYNHGGSTGSDEDLLDSMVEPFAEMSRKIRLESLAAGNKVGKISEPVLSDFGWHIIMYVGEYNNRFAGISIDTINLNDKDKVLEISDLLYKTEIKAGFNKTFYDVLYESATINNFSARATTLINSSKKETQFEKPIVKDIIKRFIK